jgi:hypothetical protein
VGVATEETNRSTRWERLTAMKQQRWKIEDNKLWVENPDKPGQWYQAPENAELRLDVLRRASKTLDQIEQSSREQAKGIQDRVPSVRKIIADEWSKAQSEKIHNPDMLRQVEKERFLDKILHRRRKRGPIS